MEVWKDIPEYEGLYQASNLGRIKSLDREVPHPKTGIQVVKGRILRQTISNKYYSVVLSKGGKRSFFHVHRLIMISFDSNRKETVNHIDGNKLNNSLDNLEWNTWVENTHHAIKTGLRVAKKGEESSSAKLTEKEVVIIKDLLNKGNLSQQKIADKFNVSRGAIQGIHRGLNWKHVK